MGKEVLSIHANFSYKISDYINSNSKLSHFKRCKIHDLDDEWDTEDTLYKVSHTCGTELYDICNNINRRYGIYCTLRDIIDIQKYVIRGI